MRNKLFQILWFSVRGIIPRKKGNGGELKHYVDRMNAQLNLAWVCGAVLGPVKLIIIGDSNASFFQRLKLMLKFRVFTVDIGIAGTRADQWADFLASPEAAGIRILVAKMEAEGARVILNVGGNNVLQFEFDKLAPGLEALKKRFPNAWAVTIPAVHTSILQALGYNPGNLRTQIKAGNELITRIFHPRVLDLCAVTTDMQTGEAYQWLTLKDGAVVREGVLNVDGIHYSDPMRVAMAALFSSVASF